MKIKNESAVYRMVPTATLTSAVSRAAAATAMPVDRFQARSTALRMPILNPPMASPNPPAVFNLRDWARMGRSLPFFDAALKALGQTPPDLQAAAALASGAENTGAPADLVSRLKDQILAALPAEVKQVMQELGVTPEDLKGTGTAFPNALAALAAIAAGNWTDAEAQLQIVANPPTQAPAIETVSPLLPPDPAPFRGGNIVPLGLPSPAPSAAGGGNEIGAVGAAVGAVGSAIDGVGGAIDGVGDAIDDVGGTLSDIGGEISGVAGSVGGLVGDVGGFIGGAIGDIGGVVNTVGEVVGDVGAVVNTVGNVVGDVGSAIGDVGNAIGDVLGSIF